MSGSTIAQYKQALEQAKTDFGEADPVRRAFENIVSFLLERPIGERQHLSFGMLRSAAGLTPDDGEILHRAIAYMTGERAKLLFVIYEFIVDEFEYALNDDDQKEFLENGEFYDPRTGLLVPDSANFIYIFFRPNSAAFH